MREFVAALIAGDRALALALMPRVFETSDCQAAAEPVPASTAEGGMILQCYIDDRTRQVLERVSRETGRSIEELAEAAIETAAMEEARGARSS